MLNVSIFGGGGEVDVNFLKLEFSMHTYLLFFFQKYLSLATKNLTKIEIFILFFQ